MGPLVHNRTRKDWLSKDEALTLRMMWDQIKARTGTVEQTQQRIGMTGWARCQLYLNKVKPSTSRKISRAFNEL
jgi:hypothetical protein